MENFLTGKIIKIEQLTPTVKSFRIEMEKPFSFIPGQYIIIVHEAEGKMLRHYSPIPLDSRQNCFELCIKIVEGGKFTTLINKFREGYKINFMGPFGGFTFKSQDKESVFVSSGTGISTLRAIIDEEIKKTGKRITLISGFRSEEEIVYQEHFENLARGNSNFNYIIVLSQPSEEWKEYRGHVQNVFDLEVRFPKDKHLYICGLPDMVDAVEKVALEKGFKDADIFYEKY